MKKTVKYSKKTANFIYHKVSDGMSVAEIARRYPTEVPNRCTIGKWTNKYPEFKELMNEAYGNWFDDRHDELDRISTAPLKELYPELEFKEACEARRARMDALKFELAKMSGILSRRYAKQTTVEHKGSLQAPQIVIQSYCIKEEQDDVKVGSR